MKTVFAVAAIVLAVTVPSLAGHTPPAPPITIDAAAAAQLREFISRDGFVSIRAPALNPSVGSTLPMPVRTRPFPSTTRFGRYRYSVVNGRTLVVDPHSRRIVGVID